MRLELKGPQRQGGWIQFAGLALSAASLGSSLIAGKDASSEAKKAAREQAKAERLTTAERIRQISQQEAAMAGETRAAAAGSGVSATRGSPLDVLAEQATEFERERTITQKVGASRVKASLDRADALAKQYKAGALTSAFGSLASMAGQLYEITGSGGGSTGYGADGMKLGGNR
jgi:hypothetical protein